MIFYAELVDGSDRLLIVASKITQIGSLIRNRKKRGRFVRHLSRREAQRTLTKGGNPITLDSHRLLSELEQDACKAGTYAVTRKIN